MVFKLIPHFYFSRFIDNKPKIDEKSAIRFYYRNELQNMKNLNKMIPQIQLPNSIAATLERELVQAPDVGYVLSKLQILSDLLSEVGYANQNESVVTTMEKFKIKLRGSLKCLKPVELIHLESLIKWLGKLNQLYIYEL